MSSLSLLSACACGAFISFVISLTSDQFNQSSSILIKRAPLNPVAFHQTEHNMKHSTACLDFNLSPLASRFKSGPGGTTVPPLVAASPHYFAAIAGFISSAHRMQSMTSVAGEVVHAVVVAGLRKAGSPHALVARSDPRCCADQWPFGRDNSTATPIASDTPTPTTTGPSASRAPARICAAYVCVAQLGALPSASSAASFAASSFAVTATHTPELHLTTRCIASTKGHALGRSAGSTGSHLPRYSARAEPAYMQHIPGYAAPPHPQQQQLHAQHQYAQHGLRTHIDLSQQQSTPRHQLALHLSFFRSEPTATAASPYFHTPTPPACQTQDTSYGAFAQLGAQGQHQQGAHLSGFSQQDCGHAYNQVSTTHQQSAFGNRNVLGDKDVKAWAEQKAYQHHNAVAGPGLRTHSIPMDEVNVKKETTKKRKDLSGKLGKEYAQWPPLQWNNGTVLALQHAALHLSTRSETLPLSFKRRQHPLHAHCCRTRCHTPFYRLLRTTRADPRILLSTARQGRGDGYKWDGDGNLPPDLEDVEDDERVREFVDGGWCFECCFKQHDIVPTISVHACTRTSLHACVTPRYPSILIPSARQVHHAPRSVLLEMKVKHLVDCGHMAYEEERQRVEDEWCRGCDHLVDSVLDVVRKEIEGTESLQGTLLISKSLQFRGICAWARVPWFSSA
ncbi:hypothetical protein K438DRAFT_1772305 [Mycena galopus ATCC 62051]|nr:hypothetical protein K438DRAFT_1772305 [Mycena galopus ATCC 62051]